MCVRSRDTKGTAMPMYSHPSCPLLLALTQLTEDHETLEALAMENITITQLLPIVTALEEICDVSFRDPS